MDYWLDEVDTWPPKKLSPELEARAAEMRKRIPVFTFDIPKLNEFLNQRRCPECGAIGALTSPPAVVSSS